jgi:hypothetical protein
MFLKYENLRRIHVIVNNRVDHGVGHGKPVERQEYMLNVRHLHDLWIVVHIDEVSMVWEPANSKDDNQNYQHSDNLKCLKIY